jgi:hypothetical protein
MRKGLLVAFLLLITSSLFAAPKDSLFVVTKNDKWVIAFTPSKTETVMDVAKRFHVPPVMLADENNTNFQNNFPVGATIYIPLGAFNKSAAGNKNVYYKVHPEDNLYRISKMSGESQRTLQEWNGMPDNTTGEGDVLIVAKIMYDGAAPVTLKADTTKKKGIAKDSLEKGQKYTVRKVSKEVLENGQKVVYLVNDTVWVDTLGVYGKMYMQQTLNETKINEEKGSAVFYTLVNKVQNRYKDVNSTVKSKFIYAFHNTAPRGTIIKVYNPASDKFVFVKVMGGLPDTKQYYNSVIGISADAKELLGVSVMEEKAWVEMKYAKQ